MLARPLLPLTLLALSCAATTPPPETGGQQLSPGWRRHIVATGYFCFTAIAGDFTGDGRVDVIAGDVRAKRTVLHVAPDWRPVELHRGSGAIHSEAFDVDGDGDLDYVGAQYQPGDIFWLEQPTRGGDDAWTARTIDSAAGNGVDGVHALSIGDVDGDGRTDLVAGSNSPKGPVADSLVFYRVPAQARAAAPWSRIVVADRDAPGYNHYLGVGDLDGDGRVEIATGAKIGNYFAFWRRGADVERPWAKQALPGPQPGATNILVADVNGDGRNDLVVSRGHGKGLAWFEGPTFGRTFEIDPALEAPHALAVGDVDGDGDVDAATTTTTSATAAWFENDGQGRFTRHVLATGQKAYDVRLTDMDGDRDLDLLVAGHDNHNVLWFENPTSPPSVPTRR